MSKLTTLIIGRTACCKSCKAQFTPNPNDLKCPGCGRRFGADEIIKELEKSRERVIDI
ncbi:MAG: hypothetical protein FWG64_02975 [Firmicutes bacterium]|nr:hypothetical protein [Bacillota bacterium]